MSLEDGILIKKDEIRQRGADLQCPGYPFKEWAQHEIDLLQKELAAILRRINDNMALDLPPCWHNPIAFCLISHHMFKPCYYKHPGLCNFYYAEQEVQQSLI